LGQGFLSIGYGFLILMLREWKWGNLTQKVALFAENVTREIAINERRVMLWDIIQL